MSTPPYAPADLSTVAAYEDDRALSFAQWNDDANRLATALAARGIGSGDTIAVRMRTRLEWLVVSLAIAKLDAVLVALNYRLTAPETTYILRDCAVRAVVLDDPDTADFVATWDELDLAVVVGIDSGTDGVASYQDLLRTEPVERQADELARLIIYTSGTTGAPKGAPLGGWTDPPDADTLADYRMSVAFDGAAGGPGNRTLVNLPMHHGAGPSYTRIALAQGGTVVFQRRFDPEATLELIDRHGITHWTCVPTMLRRILALPDEVRARYDTSSLRFLQTGAAPVGGELKKRILTEFGDDCLYEIYGATETGMMAGSVPTDQVAKPGTTGRPFRHVEMRIVDERGAMLPAGHSGEIAVRTPVVIDGYIGRGSLGPDQLDADGFYHTGDVGYLDEDGYLFINDRRTDMIIAGGVNIYPAEIEQVLCQHPAVELAGVIGIPHAELGEQPEVYVQLAEGATTDETALLEFCADKLAKYKWPRRVRFIHTLPVNPMGKIVKPELRALQRRTT